MCLLLIKIIAVINFNDPQTRYLIDFANLKHGIIKYQKNFINKDKLNKFFNNKFYGMPLLLPYGIKYFDYSNAIRFSVSKTDIRKKIFNIKKSNYVGMKIFFKYGDTFCYGAKIKKKYLKQVNFIINFNKKIIKNIRNRKKIKKAAFQTRNIPHFGHEKIFEKILEISDLIVVNPLVGLKKRNDCTNFALKKSYSVLKRIYKDKLIYLPVIANMHYCGPREAIHHLNLREKLGFDIFTVGRDHAGAENVYHPQSAISLIKKNHKKFKIQVFTHGGAYFCKKCNKIILKGECYHQKSLKEISGSEFRQNIMLKKSYKFARKEIQDILKKTNKKLFY